MRRNSRVFPLFRSKLDLTDGPYAFVKGIPMAGNVNAHGALWTTSMGLGPAGVGTGTMTFGPDNADGVAVSATNTDELVLSRGTLFDGIDWDRFRSASAGNLAAFSGIGAALVAKPGNWAINNTPAAAAAATITRAAGAAGIQHVCTGLSFGFNAINAEAGTFLVNLRDGASGAGTILQSWRVGPFAAGGSMIHSRDDLEIVGTAATALTIEFATAPAAGNFCFVDLTGYEATP